MTVYAPLPCTSTHLQIQGSGGGIQHGAGTDKLRQGAVPCDDPAGSFVNHHFAASFASLARTGFIIQHGTGQHTAVCEREIQGGNAVPHNVAVHALADGLEAAVGTVPPGCPPATLILIARASKEVFAVFGGFNFHMVKDKNTVRIGGVKKPSVMADELAAGHLKGALPHLGITAHALIENHIPGISHTDADTMYESALDVLAKLNKEKKLSVISIDNIVSGFHAYPELKIHHDGSDVETAKNLAPFMKNFLIELSEGSLFYDGVKFAIEGTHIDFEELMPFLQSEKYKEKYEIIGLTCNDITAEELYKNIKKYDTEDDWTYWCDDEDLKNNAKYFIERNEYFNKQFKKYNIKSYDTSRDRESVLNKIIRDLYDSKGEL